jgi:hypothetical protein
VIKRVKALTRPAVADAKPLTGEPGVTAQDVRDKVRGN